MSDHLDDAARYILIPRTAQSRERSNNETIYPGKVLYFSHTETGRMLNKRRCPSTLRLSDGREIQCIGEAPKSDEYHTHVGRGEGGLHLTWTDKDAEESKKVEFEQREEPFVGWRVWGLRKGSLLRSVTSFTIWKGPVLRSNGRPYSELMEERVLTNDETDYGIYSYKTPKLMHSHMMRGYNKDRWNAFGAIELSGVVVEHEKGYRAEVATFRHLWIISTLFEWPFKQTTAREMEERYQCPVDLIEPEKVESWAKFFTEEEL